MDRKNDVIAAIAKVKAETGMDLSSSLRQLKNGTLRFLDAELGEAYTIHPKTGYARRRNRWNGIYQLNDKHEQLITAHSRMGSYGTWPRQDYLMTSARILHIGDYHKLAELVIRGFKARRDRVTESVILAPRWFLMDGDAVFGTLHKQTDQYREQHLWNYVFEHGAGNWNV